MVNMIERARRRAKTEQRGFVLLFVMVLLLVMLSVGLVALNEAGDRMRESSSLRSEALVGSALSYGLEQALTFVRETDPGALAGMNHDIFGNPGVDAPLWGAGPPPGFLGGPLQFPPANPELDVDVGFRISQRTRPPPGEDVRTNYGYVAEIQLRVYPNQLLLVGGNSERRVVVGIQIPHSQSSSGN